MRPERDRSQAGVGEALARLAGVAERYAIPFLKLSSSLADTVTLTTFGLLPPLARRSGPTPRAPPDADTCALCFSGATVFLSAPRPKPFFFGSSSFFASLPSALSSFLSADDPVRPAAPSTTTAIFVMSVGWYLMASAYRAATRAPVEAPATFRTRSIRSLV